MLHTRVFCGGERAFIRSTVRLYNITVKDLQGKFGEKFRFWKVDGALGRRADICRQVVINEGIRKDAFA